jgi:hypothetical protein
LGEGRNEGRISEARRLLLLLGEIRFGAPQAETRDAIEEIEDLDRLERMSRRVVDMSVHDWEGLLNTP